MEQALSPECGRLANSGVRGGPGEGPAKGTQPRATGAGEADHMGAAGTRDQAARLGEAQAEGAEVVTRGQSLVLPGTVERPADDWRSKGARIAAEVGDAACTPTARRAPGRSWHCLPVTVLGLLPVAPRVSQSQEQQQRTQARGQLPPRRSSPARKRRHHQGRSRLLPGA